MEQLLSKGQRRLALGVMPMRAEPVDTGELTADVRHLGQALAHAVRKTAALPGNLRPDLEGRPLAVQIATLLRAHSTFSCRETVGENDRAQQARYREICRIYEDLAAAGYKLQQADGLRERHVKVLLQRWQDQHKKPATVRKRWSILRVWMLALGRPGMIGTIEQYWPDIPQPQRAGKAVGQNPRDKRLTEAQMTELMRARDLTHWYVERLHRELGLTIEEALHFDQALAANCLEGRLVLRSVATGSWRTVEIKNQEALLLVQAVQSFIAERGRKRLMWSDVTPAAALKRHQNRVAYLRAKSDGENPRADAVLADTAAAPQLKGRAA